MKYLDPSKLDFSKKSILFNPGKKYFKNIKEEEEIIASIMKNLEDERNILIRDNITLDIEIEKLNDLIEKTKIECENGENLRKKINEENNIEELNENKKNFYIENILNPLEKKIYDLKEMIIVKQQSVLAMEIVCKNNKELIRNIDKIKNITIIAFNTAILVASSLYRYNIVLDKIKSLETNNTTIKYSKIDDDSLKKAFIDVFNTIENVNKENSKFLPENEMQLIELRKLEENA